MGFSDEIARAMTTWFGADMTDAVTYNGAAIRGHVEYNPDADHRTGSVMARATLHVRRADVPAWAYRDTVAVGGLTWSVLSLAGADTHTWTLNLIRNERPVP